MWVFLDGLYNLGGRRAGIPRDDVDTGRERAKRNRAVTHYVFFFHSVVPHFLFYRDCEKTENIKFPMIIMHFDAEGNEIVVGMSLVFKSTFRNFSHLY